MDAYFKTFDLPVFIVLLSVLGLCLGSFMNVVIVRLPKMLARQEEAWLLDAQGKPLSQALQEKYNLFTPRSHCPQCQAPVKAWMNIPLLSFILLKGKCKECAKPIPKQYFLVEIFSAITGGLCAWYFGAGSKAVYAALLIWALITLTVIDFNTQLLPDLITLPLLWLGLLVNLQNTFTDLSSAVVGAAAGYMILWLIFWAFKLITGKEGMGYGDFKLLAALGAWLGWVYLPVILLLSSVVGAVFGIVLKASKKLDASGAFAFGPYLAMAGILCVFFGKQLLAFYGLK